MTCGGIASLTTLDGNWDVHVLLPIESARSVHGKGKQGKTQNELVTLYADAGAS